MSKIDMCVSWAFHLDTPDMRLVMKALGGRLKDDEMQAARELGDRLTEQRAQAIRQQMRAADKLEEAMR